MCRKNQLLSVFLIALGCGLILSAFLESGLLRIILGALLIIIGIAYSNRG